jgi:hypothetical protein
MTVSTTQNRVSYAGNGVTSAFSFPYVFFDNADLVVLNVKADGTYTKAVLGTDYTVTGAGVDTGGTVTMTTAPAVGTTLVIYRDPAMTQPQAFVDNDPLPAKSISRGYDRLTVIAQRIRELGDRSFRLSDADTSGASPVLPSPTPNAFIGWNGVGDGLVNRTITDLITISAYGTAVADKFVGDGTTKDFTLSANPGAVANLDVSISGITQEAGRDFTWDGATKLSFVSAPPSPTTPGDTNIYARYLRALPQGYADASIVNWKDNVGVARDVQSALQRITGEIVSVKDPRFGAKGDGVTDDAPALNAALTAQAANGFVLFVPPGVYLLGSTVTAQAGAVLLGYEDIPNYAPSAVGQRGRTVFMAKQTGFSGSTVLLLNGFSTLKNITVYGVPGSVDCITLNPGQSHFRLGAVWGHFGRHGLVATSANVIHAYECGFGENSGNGFQGAFGTSDHDFVSCVFNGNTGDGFYVGSGSGAIRCTNCAFEWNRTYGFETFQASNIDINGCHFDRNSGYGMRHVQVTGLVFSGNTFRRNSAAQNNLAQWAFLSGSTNVSEGANCYIAGAINDDGSGSVQPQYVGIIDSTSSVNVTSDPPAMAAGIWQDTTTQARVGKLYKIKGSLSIAYNTGTTLTLPFTPARVTYRWIANGGSNVEVGQALVFSSAVNALAVSQSANGWLTVSMSGAALQFVAFNNSTNSGTLTYVIEYAGA